VGAGVCAREPARDRPAEREGLAYQLFEPLPRRQIRKSYADNFKFGRIGRWTH
jgi:hypothetical protein